MDVSMLIDIINSHNSLHDLILKDISFRDSKFVFCISNDSSFEEVFNIEIYIEEAILDIYYFKQYPHNGNVEFEGKTISIDDIKHMIKSGQKLEILDFLVASYSPTAIITCCIYPYSENPGEYKKVFFKLCEIGKIIWKDCSE